MVYGSPHIGPRSDLWNSLKELATHVSSEWCVGGDFKGVLSPNDTGGSSHLSRGSHRFASCLHYCVYRTWDFMDSLSLGREAALGEGLIDLWQIMLGHKDLATQRLNAPGLFLALTNDDSAQLSRMVIYEEISVAMFSMGAWKAPGPDGFPVMFY
ncbi:hypothetical protein PIB30_038317 [Stylosanthes scabra]|uniref:Uncharacterized protein n=1 Tax=Stylosanthes scabra TaxID=79078 RepID=A0ABU6UFY4_9FABA|nr:hypothetical protein [Stylosanthes scabra]